MTGSRASSSGEPLAAYVCIVRGSEERRMGMNWGNGGLHEPGLTSLGLRIGSGCLVTGSVLTVGAAGEWRAVPAFKTGRGASGDTGKQAMRWTFRKLLGVLLGSPTSLALKAFDARVLMIN